MGHENDDSSIDANCIRLEERLRDLPGVEIPRELESRLLNSIPEGRSPRLRRWAPLARAACLLVVVTSIVIAALAVLPFAAPREEALATVGAGTATDEILGPTAISLEETDPCNILPPLHAWR